MKPSAQQALLEKLELIDVGYTTAMDALSLLHECTNNSIDNDFAATSLLIAECARAETDAILACTARDILKNCTEAWHTSIHQTNASFGSIAVRQALKELERQHQKSALISAPIPIRPRPELKIN